MTEIQTIELPPPARESGGATAWANAGALVLKVLGKLLGLAAKSSKVLKVGLAAGTFASYALLWSWKFALVVMLMIGFHECGHLWAMKRLGMKPRGFFFIPFFGGAAIAIVYICATNPAAEAALRLLQD